MTVWPPDADGFIRLPLDCVVLSRRNYLDHCALLKPPAATAIPPQAEDRIGLWKAPITRWLAPTIKSAAVSAREAVDRTKPAGVGPLTHRLTAGLYQDPAICRAQRWGIDWGE